jgi:hypothetical protein
MAIFSKDPIRSEVFINNKILNKSTPPSTWVAVYHMVVREARHQKYKNVYKQNQQQALNGTKT